MRPIRSLLTGTLLALALVGGSAVAVSAASSTHDTYPINDVWCFDDGLLTYCTEMTGTFKVVVSPSGDERATTNLLTEVVITDDAGQYVGEYSIRTIDQFKYDADLGMSIKVVEHTKAFDGELTCTSSAMLKIKDYELQVENRQLRCR